MEIRQAVWVGVLVAVAADGSGLMQSVIPQSVPTANKQGNSTKFQLAGTNSGVAGAGLCNDASGNTTTTGCSGGGGTPGGTDTAVQFNDATTFGGDKTKFSFLKTALATPSAPVITNGGTPGVTSYSYKVAWRSQIGDTLASADGTTATGNATLSVTNFNTITPAACPTGAYTVDVFRSVGGGGTGWIGNIACGGSLNDTGLDTCNIGAYGCLYPVINSTDGVYVSKNFRAAGHAAFGQGIVDFDPGPLVGYVDQVGVLYYEQVQTAPLPNADGAIGIESVMQIVSSGVNGGSYFAFAADIGTPATNADNINEIAGVSSDVGLHGTGNVAFAVGFDNGVSLYSAATVQRAYGLRGSASNNGPGTITAGAGINLSLPSNFGGGTVVSGYGALIESNTFSTGTYTNAYGVRVLDQTAATNNWAIKTGLGRNQFGDVVQHASVTFATLGTKAPTNGDQIYCSDCQVTSAVDNTCANGGTGAMVFRIAGAAKCMQ